MKIRRIQKRYSLISLMFKELRDYIREFAAYNLLEVNGSLIISDHSLENMSSVSTHIHIMISYIKPEISEVNAAPDGVKFFPETP